jgi:hypothetical protein
MSEGYAPSVGYTSRDDGVRHLRRIERRRRPSQRGRRRVPLTFNGTAPALQSVSQWVSVDDFTLVVE